MKKIIEWIPQEDYDIIIKNAPFPCVDVAIVHQGKILLVKRNDEPEKNKWWLPGGRLFKGEKLVDCAKRKAIEEVGIECNVGPIIQTEETIFSDGPKGLDVHSINVVYLLYPIDIIVDVTLDSHSSDFIWTNKIITGLHPYMVSALTKLGMK